MSPSRRVAPEQLRSRRWFSPDDLRSFGHRSRARQMGWDSEDWAGKPIIAILNTWSDLNSCHMHFRILADQVKRGVLQAGGMPVEIPVMSVGESYTKPTSMLYRNFLAMETEESLRSNPVDGCVLLGGCDKSTPALLMGAISMDLPAVFVPAGPMLRGNWRGKVLGSGSDVWKYWDERRAGQLSEDAWRELEDGIARSTGHCMTMGTASTMTAIAETLGFSIPGASSIPAPDSAHARMATRSGRLAVECVWAGRRPSTFLTERSFANAITVDMAAGGSTNAIIHLAALAGRAGIPLPLERFDEISRRTPLVADLRPSGRFLMEDFYYAGGLPALLVEISSLLHREEGSVTGRSLGENIEGAVVHNRDVIRSLTNPLSPDGGAVVLRGNLAPDGAVLKRSAASPHLLRHTGPAVVFSNYNDLASRIDDPDLDVAPNSVLVLQNAGPVGGPGMPEWGMLPIPKKLLQAGVRDMLRMSDARMSGTSYGACVLHIAPESAVGGPLALVENGDRITLDAEARTLSVDLPEEILQRRRAAWSPPANPYPRGFGKLYIEHVTQAPQGCDFDFLEGAAAVPEPEIH
ncbi:MAG TPA: L-arabinonate dehydratase [Verrucomicrobiales bacterium]|nr:L-arabinonate dehydratase [Verrucomicrobiales bacterium]